MALSPSAWGPPRTMPKEPLGRYLCVSRLDRCRLSLSDRGSRLGSSRFAGTQLGTLNGLPLIAGTDLAIVDGAILPAHRNQRDPLEERRDLPKG